MEVFIRVDNNCIQFALYEYGSHLVKNSYSHTVYYEVTAKLPDGTKIEFLDYYRESNKGALMATMDSGSHFITLYSTDITLYPSDESYKKRINEIIDAFKECDNVTFYIEPSDRPTTSYQFTVDTTGFEEIYKIWRSQK